MDPRNIPKITSQTSNKLWVLSHNRLMILVGPFLGVPGTVPAWFVLISTSKRSHKVHGAFGMQAAMDFVETKLLQSSTSQ
jgi:hypothetical protein